GDLAIGDVALKQRGAAAAVADQRGDRLASFAIAVAVNRDLDAQHAEPGGDSRADARTGAYDQAPLAFEIRAHRPVLPPDISTGSLTTGPLVVKLVFT